MNELEKLAEEISKLQKKIDEDRKKDIWDKINVVGSNLTVPLLIAAIAAGFTYLQHRENLQLGQRQLETTSQNELLDNENQRLLNKNSQAEIVEGYIPGLISTNDTERFVAQEIVRHFFPDLGEKLLTLMSKYDISKENRNRATSIISSRVTQSISKDIPFLTNWPRTRGDSDMDTDGNDRVPVSITSRLLNTGREVVLELDYHVQEYGGDHTTFSGTKRRVLYTSAATNKIVSVEAPGGLSARFKTVSVGKKHGRQSIDSSGTFWTRLLFDVDSPGQDKDAVGVEGNVNFTVILEPSE